MAAAESVICAQCSQPVKGKIISALGKSWHPEHFICQECKKPITGNRFNQKNDMPYCEDCYSELYLPRCTVCEKPIKERVIMALGKEWHEEHFVCTKCGKNLAGTNFFEKDGKPYCFNDFNNGFAPRCAGCNLPISDAAIVALGEKWHPSCFVCSKCGKPVTDSLFEVENGKPICSKCSTP